MANKIITGWCISVTWENSQKPYTKKNENILDVPDHVATVVDEWLTELEEKNNGKKSI